MALVIKEEVAALATEYSPTLEPALAILHL
jgi:hypothetical protein